MLVVLFFFFVLGWTVVEQFWKTTVVFKKYYFKNINMLTALKKGETLKSHDSWLGLETG